MFINCKSSLVEVCGLLMYMVISSGNNDTLAFLFPICTLLISFSCVIALARMSSAILNRYGESG